MKSPAAEVTVTINIISRSSLAVLGLFSQNRKQRGEKEKKKQAASVNTMSLSG